MDFDQVLPAVFVGAHPKTTDDIDELKAVGITAVLNLQSDEDFNNLGVDWASLHARYRMQNIEAQRVPIRDFDDDDLRDKLPDAAKTLNHLVGEDHQVYVHCSAGVNRSPSVVIAYLHWFDNRTLDVAGALVQKNRPCSPVMEVIRRATWDRKNL